MLALMLASLAQATPAGHFHPEAVARQSARFAEAQATSGAPFQALQERSAALAAALVAYEEGLDLLGDRAPEGERARHAALERTFLVEQTRVRMHAEEQAEASMTAFEAALERALAAQGVELVVCQPRADRGLRMGPRPSGGDAPDTCPGDDRNQALAAALDADPALARAVTALGADPWPGFTLDGQAQAPVGGGDRALDVRAVMRAGAASALQAITRADEAARSDLQADLEGDEVTEALRQDVMARARTLTARTAAARASLAAPVLLAVDERVDALQRKGGAEVGWCAQPPLLGGCAVPLLDAEATAALLAHPKVRRALGEAAASTP